MTYEESPQVLSSITEIETLREKIDSLNFDITQYQRLDDKIEYLHTLYALAEKYENLYTRACLDTLEGSSKLRDDIIHDLRVMGMTVGRDPHFYFKENKYHIIMQLKDLGQPVDEHLDLY